MGTLPQGVAVGVPLLGKVVEVLLYSRMVVVLLKGMMMEVLLQMKMVSAVHPVSKRSNGPSGLAVARFLAVARPQMYLLPSLVKGLAPTP